MNTIEHPIGWILTAVNMITTKLIKTEKIKMKNGTAIVIIILKMS